MRKWGSAVAALGIALAVTACGGGPNSDPSPATTSAAAEIHSWQDWGKAGQEWLSQCGAEDWDCINRQVTRLSVEAKFLPDRQDPGLTEPRTIIKFYRDIYNEYAALDCHTAAVMCLVKVAQMRTTMDDVTSTLDHLAAGKKVDGT